MKRPLILYPLLALHTFLGIGAVAGGALLVIEPHGSLLGMDPAWLDGSPFRSYFIPGLVLFTLNGLLPLFTAVGLLLRPNWRWPNVLNM